MRTQTNLIWFFESFGYRWPFTAEKPMKMGVTPLHRANTVAQKRKNVSIRRSEILKIRDWECGCYPWRPYSEIYACLEVDWSPVYHTGIWKWRAHSLHRMVWIFALVAAVDVVMACPCALPGAMNFAWAQGMVALLLLRLFCVEALTISSPCHRFNYLTTFLIHTSADPVRSPWLHCKLHTFRKYKGGKVKTGFS